MKSNIILQASLNLSNPAQKTWYAANILKAACTSSPAVAVRTAVAAIAAKPAIIAQTAKPARAASVAVLAANNTTGYGFGELYLNSPAYPIGTAIPAIPAKPASAAVVGVPAIVGVPAVAALNSPAVVAIAGTANLITITKDPDNLFIAISVDFPVSTSPRIVGSTIKKVDQFTPATLQATAWLGTKPTTPGSQALGGDIATETLEQYLDRNMLLCPGVIISYPSAGIKRIAVILSTDGSFDFDNDELQLGKFIVSNNNGGVA